MLFLRRLTGVRFAFLRESPGVKSPFLLEGLGVRFSFLLEGLGVGFPFLLLVSLRRFGRVRSARAEPDPGAPVLLPSRSPGPRVALAVAWTRRRFYRRS